MDTSTNVPDSPDPAALISKQAQTNRIDTYTPYGSGVYSGPDNTTLTVNLSPGQQAIQSGNEGIQRQMLQRGQGYASQLPSGSLNFEGLPGYVSQLDTSGMPDLVGGQDVTQAIYDQGTSLLKPQFEQQNRDFTNMMNDRGLPITGEAWNTEGNRVQQGQDQALTSLANQATVSGANLASQNRSQLMGEATTAANMQNQARTQGIGERQSLRANSFNELSSILSGSPVQMPQVPGAAPIDVTGPYNQQYAGQLAQYNAQQSNASDAMGGIFGIGKSIATQMPWSSWF